DFYYRIFNADGTEIGQCGNGARCLARFVAHYGLTSKKTINLATKTTVIKAHLNQDQSVTLDMGLPNWQPRLIPLAVSQQQDFYTLTLADNTPLKFHALSLGNPHAVTIVVDVDTIQIDKLGVEISEHILFPQQTNAGFMQLIDESNIKLRVYERGCGETMACGSGAVAAVAVGMKFYSLGKCIQVHVPGGELIVELSGTNNSLLLTGSAVFVYEGELFT
ncbi:MAG: diaminopimelate epimerase, partial [Legionellales bacterium RIFCSPHIGHO2_12_FULL_42_9]